jgi:hypothetical protein
MADSRSAQNPVLDPLPEDGDLPSVMPREDQAASESATERPPKKHQSPR